MPGSTPMMKSQDTMYGMKQIIFEQSERKVTKLEGFYILITALVRSGTYVFY